MSDANVTYKAKVPSAIVGGTTHATTETQFLDANGTILTVMIPGGRVNGIPFKVKISGRVTGGTTTNFTLNLDYGISTTYTSNTTVATSGAVAVDSANSNFHLEVTFVWDSTSGKLMGMSDCGWFGNTPTVHTAAVTTAVSSVDLSSDGYGFTVTGLFSSSHANNAAYITQFELCNA